MDVNNKFNMSDITEKKNRKNQEHNGNGTSTKNGYNINSIQIHEDELLPLLNKGNNNKSLDKNWEEFIAKRPYQDEFEAFAKYFEKAKDIIFNDDNTIKDKINLTEVLSYKKDDYCDLYDGIKTSPKVDIYNLDHRPLKKGSDEILHASPFLQLKDNAEKGRHLVAHCQIDKNEVIITEKATVLQVNPLCRCVGNENKLYRCHECAKVCSAFYTCNNCNIVLFCSMECLKRAHKMYHKYECDGLQRHMWSFDETDYSYIAFRTMLYGFSVDFNTAPKNSTCYGDAKNNYPFIYRLKSNFNKLPLQKIQQILKSCTKTLFYLILRTRFFAQFAFDKSCPNMYVFIGGLLAKHYCQAQINNILIDFPDVTKGFGFNVVSGRGKAICPTIAMINHSCSPNSVIIPFNNYLIVKTMKPIRADEEITVCYNEISAFLTVSDRQIITEELFNFTCKCTLCDFERTWEEYPYKCPYCVNGKAKKITIGKQEFGYCIVCEQNFKTNVQVERIAKICGKLYRATFELSHVLRIAECYSTLYPNNSWMLLDVYRLLFEKYTVWGAKPIETIKYGILCFNILEHYIPKLYPPLLEAKINFYTEALMNENLIKLERVTDFENETLKIFHTELLKTKKNLLFYVPVQYIDFYYVRILGRLEQIQSNVLVSNNMEPQEPKSL